MSNLDKRRLLGFILPLFAVGVLTVLLIFALARLSQIQQDMRSNDNANMLWVLSQTQATALRTQTALLEFITGKSSAGSLSQTEALLNSRLKLLRAGPQARVVHDLDPSGQLSDTVDKLYESQGAFDKVRLDDTGAAGTLMSHLHKLDNLLSVATNKAMVMQWESWGGRLDRYRDSVLTVIFLMIGICFCSLLISASLFLGMKRVRESEWLKRQAVQLTGQLEAERQVNELHRNFNAMISHQFRTPLAIIDTSMQRLQRSIKNLSPEFIDRHAGKTRRAVARLERMVEHSLIAEQYADRIDVRLQPCSLARVARTAVQQEQALFPQHTINFEADEATLPQACCDPVLAEHIIANLLSNAIKYSDSDLPVSVRVYQEDDRIVCEVADQGRGIAEEDIPKLFERYYRAASVTSIQGTGMGLFVAQRLATLQSGSISVASRQGAGSTFSVSFPLVQDNKEQAA